MTQTLQAERTVTASLLESRPLCASIAGAAFVHVGMVAAGLGGWPCPMLQSLGIPCPGCGLGRACSLLIKGDAAHAFQIHAFAPITLIGVALFSIAAVLPVRRRLVLARSAGLIEKRWPVTPMLLWGVILYWVLRLALDAPAFIRLVK